MAEAELPDKITTDIRLKTLGDATSFLIARREQLTRFLDAEDLATADDFPDLNAVLHHMGIVKRALAQTLWSEQFFIGPSILDEIVFRVIVDNRTTDPLSAALQKIRDIGFHQPGIVVYPVHSFGILGAGFFRIFEGKDVFLDLPDAGICITPQTNSLKQTIAFLEHASELFEIGKNVPRDVIHHHHRSSLDWLERNPLLAVKANTYSGYAYENQSLLLTKLEICTTLIFMLSVLAPEREESKIGIEGSSTLTNNWQTLDINHYLVLESGPASRPSLEARRVPMNVKRTDLTNLCDLHVEIDPRNWHNKPPILSRVVKALNRIEAGFTRCSVAPDRNDIEARIYRKLFDALGWFRRSFHSQVRKGEPAVFLATAFEMLLTDSFSAGVKPRLQRRFGLATNGSPEAAGLVPVVEQLYERRSETVHQGRVDGLLDIRAAQKAFTLAFIGLVEALDKLPAQSPNPIAAMLGDQAEKQSWWRHLFASFWGD